MNKKRTFGTAGAVAMGLTGAVFFAAPAQAAETCYEWETQTWAVWNVETYTETVAAVPGTPGTPAIPAVPAVPAVPDSYAALGNYADTRATGHYAAGADGLHIWTEGATSTDKVAGYLDIADVPLAADTTASLGYVANFGITPGAQLVVDINGDGVGDGILVGEAVYGDNWWLTNGSSAEFKALDPSGAENGGNGSEWFGTLAEWAAASESLTITHVGFSLGSGVHGDGTVTGFTVNGTTHSFVEFIAGSPEVPGTPEVPAVPEVPGTPAEYAWVVTSEGQIDAIWPEGINTTPENPIVGDTRTVSMGTEEVGVEVEVECAISTPVGPDDDENTGTPASNPVPARNLAVTGGGDVNPILPIAGGGALLAGIAALMLRRRQSLAAQD